MKAAVYIEVDNNGIGNTIGLETETQKTLQPPFTDIMKPESRAYRIEFELPITICKSIEADKVMEV